MNTESAAAIVEILIRLDARLDKLETMMTEMKGAQMPAFNQTPGRALQGWGREASHHSRLGDL